MHLNDSGGHADAHPTSHSSRGHRRPLLFAKLPKPWRDMSEAERRECTPVRQARRREDYGSWKPQRSPVNPQRSPALSQTSKTCGSRRNPTHRER